MDKLWKNLRGTLLSIFGIGHVNLKDNAGVLEARNDADDAYIKVSIADPTDDQNAATKKYVDDAIDTVNPDSSGSLKEEIFTINTDASQQSTYDLPANCRVREAWLEITTAYSAGTIIEIGDALDQNLFMESTYNKPTKVGIYSVEQNTLANSTAGKVVVTISGSPSVGAGTVIVRYAVA